MEGIRSFSVEDPQEGQFAGIVYTAPAPGSRRQARSDSATASPTERGLKGEVGLGAEGGS